MLMSAITCIRISRTIRAYYVKYMAGNVKLKGVRCTGLRIIMLSPQTNDSQMFQVLSHPCSIDYRATYICGIGNGLIL